ncbi:MAG: acyl-CoA dehydrogenase family protein [Chloroflexi bacterium]|nr:acyl-CoA dehydrogenase family protein [Chloroflexota bacterium]
MEFGFTREEQSFREEVRAFLRQELPVNWVGSAEEWSGEGWEFVRQMRKKLAARGWLTMGWPKEYGGMGASHMTQGVFAEEMSYHRAPGRDIFGVRMLGPTLMVFGAEEQKRLHLPYIARGERVWCQGYSEPGTGSDLASLQTRAVEDGDDFVLNGSKIWTSGAHRADWMFLLARTDPSAPRHKGITFFLMDMKSPGVTVRPLVNMAGFHSFNQVFFDNVRVPKANIVGEKDKGWYVGMTLLDFERSGMEYIGVAFRTLDEISRAAREVTRDGQPLVRDPLVRHKLAEMAVECQVGRALAYRVAWLQTKGEVPAAEASAAKVFGSELNQRLANVGMQILGLYGQLDKESKYAFLDGIIKTHYLYNVSLTIAGGTSEVQRQVIALRGLGLPRGQ